ncbi:MAG: response regulator [Alphaproteobacteria bacterium]
MELQFEEAVNILLVEDNDGDIILTTEAFKSAETPNELHVCKSAEDALDFLKKRGEYAHAPRPDLILLDLNLPRMSGQEALEIIKNDDTLCEIPTLVMTSSSAESDIAESYRRHANSYVVKPFGLQELTNIVRAIETFWFNISKLPRGGSIPPYTLNG